MLRKSAVIVCSIMLMVVMIGCSSFPRPDQMRAPEPIYDNTGKYMCPYTQDDTIAEWVDTGMKAAGASSIGKAVGRAAGAELLKKVPLIGSLLGEAAGNAAGRAIAIKSSGGWEAIRASTDLSFMEMSDMAVWLYVTKSHREEYKDVLKLTCGIYDKLCKKYNKYIKKEYKRQQKGR